LSAGYATQRSPRGFELLEVLSSIAAYQDAQFKGKGPRWGKAGVWCIVRQVEIIAWYQRFLKRFGRLDTICRRTLSYQVAGLKRRGFLQAETQRHQRDRRTGKLALRPSIYVFTTLGRLWIKRRMGWVANPFDHLAVQKTAQSGFKPVINSSTSLSSAVDKAPTAEGGKTAKLRRRSSSRIAGIARRPAKALVRKGPRSAARRARKAQAPRRATGSGRTAKRRRRRA
jgi:hypothetical protein